MAISNTTTLKGRAFWASELSGLRSPSTAILAMSFIACVIGSNWAIERFGIVPVGFGLAAPAGVYFAGLSFGIRDAVQERTGRRVAAILVVIGALISVFISPQFALASGLAYLLSEMADLTVYTKFRDTNWPGAVIGSNIVGAIIDSCIFLWLAFGSLEYVAGNTLGKVWMTALAMPIVWYARKKRR